MLSVGFKERNMHQHLQIYLNQQHINIHSVDYMQNLVFNIDQFINYTMLRAP
jgi:hypothetical protein